MQMAYSSEFGSRPGVVKIHTCAAGPWCNTCRNYWLLIKHTSRKYTDCSEPRNVYWSHIKSNKYARFRNCQSFRDIITQSEYISGLTCYYQKSVCKFLLSTCIALYHKNLREESIEVRYDRNSILLKTIPAAITTGKERSFSFPSNHCSKLEAPFRVQTTNRLQFESYF